MQDQLQETLPEDPSATDIAATYEASEEEVSVTERLATLIHDMAPYKAQLLGIVAFCKEEKTAEEIDEMLEPLREHRVCTYSPINLRTILVNAGALIYNDNDEEAEEVTDEEGNLILPEETATPTWLATEEALAFCASLNPYADLLKALETDSDYIDAYVQVLQLCSGEGCKVSTIEHTLNDSGILDGSVKQPGYFVGKLEDLGAIEWKGAWQITPLGLQYLEGSTEG